ncbi:hypothetical protein H2201_007284 [Coniosporium apollinis]|uniref:Uncharacterized protein n=2 Tax=Coniosporium TaxID=2810619 RepID=A0ACC2YXE6_9PEZI|nr:hypothetical protein H2199_006171 [Cladosporium sp. JES 115]KAJ9659535.1 hypothetical protein H2201_007284 [Coniosporium apollinis]
MGDHSAFFYGTLMAPEVLHRVCHGSHQPNSFYRSLLTIRPAILPHHRRHKVLHADYPAMIPCASPSASVRGTLVTGLTDGDMWRLDIFEGDEYERRTVKVEVLDEKGRKVGEVEGVETYVWIAGRKELEDEEWDFEVFVREKMGRWIGVDEGFADVDDAVKAQQADPTGGRGVNGSIGKTLEQSREAKKELLESAV